MAQNRMREQKDHTQGRLLARPEQSAVEARLGGPYPLELDGARDGFLYVPSSYQVKTPAPFVLMLHGAGSTGRSMLTPFLPLAESAGILFLAPDSRQRTWDFTLNRYNSDVAFIE